MPVARASSGLLYGHYLAVIQSRLTAIRQGSYGKCEHCGAELSFAELDELPWADACRACSTKE